ncbi:MAG: protein kinase [Pirellulaceae bacterium]|jgi:hypothetical protein|nr:protein kinase [Pirellulaceae bacterium]MDP7014832.1 protein kinase [Pirellulaceae bacterium]
MDTEHTEHQDSSDLKRARDLSLKKTQPPTQVPGYQIEDFLGAGAYGEVWVGVNHNTGRRVAIKFYTHRGGVDWSLLSREVEKLVFLSADRYVVQLLDVGWDADPPYYVMDYIENGSLNDRLENDGPMDVDEATNLFREISVGLVHAHGKGVLHCDLKPANVLLDVDAKPRLADFGQSRLSHEQSPSLGTLFYMAPEQADLDAVPDARWDVYGLGALYYCALTGDPPHRSSQALDRIDDAESLLDRLKNYREVINSSPTPTGHRRLPGMDRSLADIVERCLSADPRQRYANVQGILDALRDRDRRRARLPQVILGFVGPLLLLLVMALFGWRGYSDAIEHSQDETIRRAHESNQFAAQAIAGRAAESIERYFNSVEQIGRDTAVHDMLRNLSSSTEDQLQQLADPANNSVKPFSARTEFLQHESRSPVQELVDGLLANPDSPDAASWFVCDKWGTQVAAAFAARNNTSTVGKNYSWRTYFHGGPDDLRDADEQPIRPPPNQHIRSTRLSAPFQSQATNKWKIAIATPIYDPVMGGDEEFLGVVALTVDLGLFSRFEEGTDSFFAVLIDDRLGGQQGMVLQHPIFEGRERLPGRFSEYRVKLDPDNLAYYDPFGKDVDGGRYDREWIFAEAPVVLQRGTAGGGREPLHTGLTVVVQEDYASAIRPVQELGRQMLREGLLALGVVLLVVFALWGFVIRAMGSPATSSRSSGNGGSGATPIYEMTTMAAPRRSGGPGSRKPSD